MQATTTVSDELALPTEAEPVRIIEGGALAALARLPDACVDSVVTDPPYPCIERSYGYWTEAEWFALMDPLVAECRRVLKPTGSAVFVLQPNSERVGKMRPWLWEFMAKWTREWGMVQDAYWLNTIPLPTGNCDRSRGLMRPSVKPTVWLGDPDCYRNQDAILIDAARQYIAAGTLESRTERTYASGSRVVADRIARVVAERGGVTPFNAQFFSTGNTGEKAGGHGHGAGTPMPLMRWWIRYITPPGGTVLDPFLGSGTCALAALAEGRRAIGIERIPEYAATARKRIADATSQPSLFA